jgi:hypothetical protein
MSRIRSRPATCAVGQLPGDKQAALAADLHAPKSLVEAGNQAAHSLRKRHRLHIAHLGLAVGSHHRLAVFILLRLAMIVRRVELVTIVGAAVAAQVAGVKHLEQLAGLGIGAGPDLVVLINAALTMPLTGGTPGGSLEAVDAAAVWCTAVPEAAGAAGLGAVWAPARQAIADRDEAKAKLLIAKFIPY